LAAGHPPDGNGSPGSLDIVPDIHLVGTDGWINLPGEVPIPGTTGQFYNPDSLAPTGLNLLYLRFRNVTGLTDEQVQTRKMKAQATAPLFWVNENQEYYLKLGNLGLQMRPDLTDSHTLHWHGFRNAGRFSTENRILPWQFLLGVVLCSTTGLLMRVLICTTVTSKRQSMYIWA